MNLCLSISALPSSQLIPEGTGNAQMQTYLLPVTVKSLLSLFMFTSVKLNWMGFFNDTYM